MTTQFALACLVADLRRAIAHAVAAKIDEHFVSELKHLLATAQHNEEITNNEEANNKENNQLQGVWEAD